MSVCDRSWEPLLLTGVSDRTLLKRNRELDKRRYFHGPLTGGCRIWCAKRFYLWGIVFSMCETVLSSQTFLGLVPALDKLGVSATRWRWDASGKHY